MSQLEYDMLKRLVKAQERTNELLVEIKEAVTNGRTTTRKSDVPEGEGTIRRKRGPNRNVQ
jgi:hypothetical protein